MKRKPQLPKPRNLLHDHPLLRKGHAHQNSKKPSRQAIKRALRRGEDFHNALLERIVEIRPGRSLCAMIHGGSHRAAGGM